jgi:hypothetical protein
VLGALQSTALFEHAHVVARSHVFAAESDTMVESIIPSSSYSVSIFPVQKSLYVTSHSLSAHPCVASHWAEH